MRSKLHQAALDYAAKGWPVFPISPGTKVPLPGSRGFKDATRDTAQITEWWTDHPDANIGFEPDSAGMAVVDLDVKKDGIANFTAIDEDKPVTAVVRTPSGGEHWYFLGRLPGSQSKIALGVDTRGKDSYVLLPPSIVDGKPYVELCPLPEAYMLPPVPAWITERCKVTPADKRRADPDFEEDTPMALVRATADLAAVVKKHGGPLWGQEDPETDTFALACHLKDLGLSFDKIVDMLAEPMPAEREWLEFTVGNAWKYGQNEAGSDDWNPKIDWAELAREQANGATAAETPSGDKPVYPPFKRLGEIRHTVYPPVSWLWQDRLLDGEPNLYVGDAGTGKTTLIQNLAVAVSAGIPLLGHATTQREVAMIVAEDEYRKLRDNLAEIAQKLGIPDDVVDEHIHLLSVKYDRVPGGHMLARIEDNKEVKITHFMEHVACELQALKCPVLLMLDPLGEFVSFDRNRDDPARALSTDFLGPMVCGIGGVHNTTVLITDHPSKMSMREGQGNAGSLQIKAGFSLMAELKAGDWEGGLSPRRPLTFKVLKAREAAETTTKLWRIGNDPLFYPPERLNELREDQVKVVYQLVCQWIDRGWAVSKTDAGEHGPSRLADELAMNRSEIDAALKHCLAVNWLVYYTKNGASDAPSSYVRGDVLPELNDVEPY